VSRKPHGSGDPPIPEDSPRQPNLPKLSSRHRATLAAIFEKPARGDILWRDIERLFEALGGSVSSGAGSRRRVKLGERKAVFHEPHPERVTDEGAVADVRKFLISVGVRP
jgi:HicA toxin of bacterial toxin-antitoxin,